MTEGYARCKCGMGKKYHTKASGGDGGNWECKCEKFTPMVCAKCGKAIDKMTICKYDLARDYYCVEHCPNHEWQSDYDWPTECKHCGIHQDKYLRAEVDRLEAENKELKARMVTK